MIGVGGGGVLVLVSVVVMVSVVLVVLVGLVLLRVSCAGEWGVAVVLVFMSFTGCYTCHHRILPGIM